MQRIDGGYRGSRLAPGSSESAARPLVSIVTVVWNGAATIQRTIDSVLAQIQRSAAEYIVIDGASTDGTVELIRRYEEQIAYWSSERDRGIYNAMNKGWMESAGQYVYYLGADDILLNLPYNALAGALKNDIDIVYGNIKLSNGRLFRSHYGASLIFDNTLHHQGLFLRRDRFNTGPFDEQYRIFADFDLNQRLYQRKLRAVAVDDQIACFDVQGASHTLPKEAFFKEYLGIVRQNYGPAAAAGAYVVARAKGLARRLQHLFRL